MATRTAFPGTSTTGTTHNAADDNALPGGWIGYVEVTADQLTITTETDLTGLSVTPTVNTTRRIRITGEITCSFATVGDSAKLRIKEGVTVLQEIDLAATNGTGGPSEERMSGSVILTPSSGAHTYKLSLTRSSGTGSASLKAGSTRPAYLLVEDIGPAS